MTMNAITLAAKAGAAPHPSEYRKPEPTGAEKLYANILALKNHPRRQQIINDAWDRWYMDVLEQSGVADLVRRGVAFRSIDYVVGVDPAGGKDFTVTWSPNSQ